MYPGGPETGDLEKKEVDDAIDHKFLFRNCGVRAAFLGHPGRGGLRTTEADRVCIRLLHERLLMTGKDSRIPASGMAGKGFRGAAACFFADGEKSFLSPDNVL